MNTYYQPSGKFSIMSFVWWLLAAAIGMPLLAMIYAYAIWYIPIIYFNLALVLLLGGAVGLLVDYAAIRQGKVRNPMLATVLGGLAGLVALYFQWAVWLDLVVNAGDQIGTDSIGITVSNIKFWQVFSLAINPDVMLELIGKVYDVGTWGIKGSTVSGGFLGLVWLLEAVGVLALSAFLPRLAASKPYDESSDTWMSEVALPPSNYIDLPAELVAELELGNYTNLENLQAVANAEENHSILTLFHADQTDYFLSIENKLMVLDKNGKKTFQGTDFLQYLSISKAMGDKLLRKVN